MQAQVDPAAAGGLAAERKSAEDHDKSAEEAAASGRKTLASNCVQVQPDGWARGEREGYGGPRNVTSLLS